MSGKVGRGKLLKNVEWNVNIAEYQNITSKFRRKSDKFSIEHQGIISEWLLMSVFSDRDGSKVIGLYLKPLTKESINFDCTYDLIVLNHTDALKSKLAPDDEHSKRRLHEWKDVNSWGNDIMSLAELFDEKKNYVKNGKVNFIVTIFEDSLSDECEKFDVNAFDNFFIEAISTKPEIVTLKCSDGVDLVALKRAISQKSAVMQAMFENDMEEKKNGSVNVIEFDSDVMRELLRFMYSGRVHEIEKIDAFKLYEAAKVYMLNDLKVMCVRDVKKGLTLDNIVEIIEFADFHDETEIYELCLLLIYRLYTIPNIEAKMIDELSPKLQARVYKDLLKIATGGDERYCKVTMESLLTLQS